MPAGSAQRQRRCAGDTSGDLGGDDERGQHVRGCRAARLRERQNGGDDRGDGLAGKIGEVEIHVVSSNAVGERGELRRGAKLRIGPSP
jgi:hypothetical protein